jgi:hypothetical protein
MPELSETPSETPPEMPMETAAGAAEESAIGEPTLEAGEGLEVAPEEEERGQEEQS